MRTLLPSSLTVLALLAIPSTAAAQAVLIMTNSTTDTLMAFSPVDGSIVNASLFAIPNTTQVSAIDVNGEIWISEQTGDRISRYDAAGNVLGTIGPTFVGGGLDNIRGIAFINNTVYVTNSGTANGAPGNAIEAFDTAGNFLFQFTTQNLATSPFSVMAFQGDLLVAGSSNADDVHRFTLAGTDVGTFHNSASISFAHQVALASDGNVWCAGFTTGGISKLDATTGALLSSFPAAGARGVFELQNGNVMWTNANGAWVYDVATSTSNQITTGGCYHLNLYGAGPVASATPFGTGCDGLVLSANGLPSIGNAAFELHLGSVPAVSPIGLFGFGTVAVNPGVDLTFLGMAGCFAHTSLDIGVFAGGPVSGGTSVFPLPIPASSALAGFGFASQGVSFSLTTAFGLATSNGLQLVVN